MHAGRPEGESRLDATHRPPDGLFTLHAAGLPDCFVLDPKVSADERGSFVKVFHAHAFAAHGLATMFAEQYYSVSRRGVLRGMHLQVSPHAHAKVVYCVAGSALDVLLDLRRGSPTFGQHRVFELSAGRPRALYVAPGVAHGFYASDDATLVYNATTVHAPDSDTGVRWNSFGMTWPTTTPLLSARDRGLPGLDEFESPFVFLSREP